MSIVSDILHDLWHERSSYYRNRNANMFGFSLPNIYKKKTVMNTLHRLRRQGYISRDEVRGWFLTPKGKEYTKKRTELLQQFPNPFKSGAVRNLLIMFDIPESQKGEREWFRSHLKKFNYIMIQKSVWAGPSPLPKEFLLYLKKTGLHKTMKTLKLARGFKGKGII